MRRHVDAEMGEMARSRYPAFTQKYPSVKVEYENNPEYGAKFIVLPEASHSINWEQPEAFNRNVLEFIRRH